MAVSFTVAASAKDLQPGWRVSEQMNGRNVMTGSIVSLDGTYRPTNGSVVEFTDGATVYFKGIINDLDEGGLGGYGATPIQVAFGCADYNAYADWRQMELTIAAGGNLKSGLTKIATALSGYGVTLHASQANGPTFTEAFALDLAPISEILDKLSVATGYGWDIDYDKVLSMSSPGTTAAGSANNAPFNIAAGNGMAIGDITVKPSLGDFANVVFVRYSSAPTTAYAFFEMTANPSDTQTVTVGGKTYTFQTTLTNVDGNVQIDANYLVTITNFHRAITLQGTPGTDYATAMTVNAQVTAGMQSDNSIRVVALQAGAGGNSIACTETCANANWRTEGGSVTTTLLFGTDETMNLWVRSPEAAASMPSAATRVDRTINHPEIRDAATAQLMADGYRARYLQIPNEIHYRTLTNGLHPGMKQSIVEAKRNLNSANCLITNVELSAVGNVIWYDITAVDALVIPPDGMEFWHGGGGGSGSGGGGGGSGVSITTLTIGANGLINSGATAWGTGTGFWLDYNAGTPRFRVGSVAGNRLVWDGADLTVVSERLTIDDAGVLIAPDGTSRAELSGFRFGDGFGLYGTETSVGNARDLEVVCEAEGIAGSGTPRLILKAKETDGGGETSITLTKTGIVFAGGPVTLTPATAVHGAVAYSTATALALTAAGTSGQILRSAGAAAPTWSTATYPATVVDDQILYGTATNVIGGSSLLLFDGTTFSVLSSDGGFTTGASAHRFDRYSNTAANGTALNLRRARGTTPGTAAILQDGDTLGGLYFRGHDGASINIIGAAIEAEIQGTPGTNDLPTNLVFKTTPVGGSAPVAHLTLYYEGGLSLESEVGYDLFEAGFGAFDVRLGSDADYPVFDMRRSRVSLAAPELVEDGDTIGSFGFYGHDGVSFRDIAKFTVIVDGTAAEDSTPGAVVIATTPTGSTTAEDALKVGQDKTATLYGGILFATAITPTQLTANTDNWNPTDMATAGVIRIDVSTPINLTGIVAQASGRMYQLHNATANIVTLKHDTTSTAANRWYCPGAIDFPLSAGRTVWIRYDGTRSRWTISG